MDSLPHPPEGGTMLLSFSVKNYGPFREQATLDMRAARAYKELPENLLPSSSSERVLRTAAIYGANAAGKTQLVNAYYAFARSYSDLLSRLRPPRRTSSMLASQQFRGSLLRTPFPRSWRTQSSRRSMRGRRQLPIRIHLRWFFHHLRMDVFRQLLHGSTVHAHRALREP